MDIDDGIQVVAYHGNAGIAFYVDLFEGCVFVVHRCSNYCDESVHGVASSLKNVEHDTNIGWWRRIFWGRINKQYKEDFTLTKKEVSSK